jgi:hypothetical protein
MAGAVMLQAAVVHVSRHFKVFACLAYLAAAAERIAEAILHAGPIHEIRSNNLTQFFVNYPEHGFAKRALVGTVLHPLLGAAPQPEVLAFWIMVVLNVAGFAVLLVLADRFVPHDAQGGLPAFLRCAMAIGSVGAVQIAHDLGRFDLVNYLVLLGVIWLALRGAVVAAALGLVAGILIHEAFVLYAAPLGLAVAWRAARRTRTWPGSAARIAPMALAAVAAALAILSFGNSDRAAALDVGTGAYVWRRGLIEIGTHLPPAQIAVLAVSWLALAVIVAASCRGRSDASGVFIAAALCPLALNLFGIDHGRWLTIGFVMLVINLAVQVQAFGLSWPVLRPWQKGAVLVLCLPLGPHGVTGAWAWLF